MFPSPGTNQSPVTPKRQEDPVQTMTPKNRCASKHTRNVEKDAALSSAIGTRITGKKSCLKRVKKFHLIQGLGGKKKPKGTNRGEEGPLKGKRSFSIDGTWALEN